MKVLADTALILDLFANRHDFVEVAERLWTIAQSPSIEIHLTECCLETVRFYLSRPDPQFAEDAIDRLKIIFKGRIIQVTFEHIDQARLLPVRDFEVALEMTCAMSQQLNAIVTQHPEKYTNSTIPIWTVDGLIARDGIEATLLTPSIKERRFQKFPNHERHRRKRTVYRFATPRTLCGSAPLNRALQTAIPHAPQGAGNPPLEIEILRQLKELTEEDIHWLGEVGSRKEILPNQILIQEKQPIDALYIVLDGVFEVSTTGKRTFQSNIDSSKISLSLVDSQLTGEMSFIEENIYLASATVKAVKKSLIWSISRSILEEKIAGDSHFGGRFYRVVAETLSKRLRLMNEAHTNSASKSLKKKYRPDFLQKLLSFNSQVPTDLSPGMLLVMIEYF